MPNRILIWCYLIFGAAAAGFLLFAERCCRAADKSYGVIRNACILFVCTILAYAISISVFPFPSQPAIFFPLSLVLVCVLFILPFYTMTFLLTGAFFVFLVLVLLFKTPRSISYDLFSGVTALILVYFLLYIITDLRLRSGESLVKLEVLNRASLVVVDANLPPESLAFLAANLTPPLFADPVSVRKAGRLHEILSRLTAMKPNRPEASLLTGVEIQSNADLPRAAEAFFSLGLKNVFISLGGEGVYYDDGHERGILPCFPSPVVNTTGCGDAFLAAVACAWQDGHTLREMALRGLAASAICACTDSAVSPLITPDAIESMVQNA